MERAFESQDIGHLYHNDVEVWRNNHRMTQSKGENLATLKFFFDTLAERGFSKPVYQSISRQATTNGFVQQHVVKATRGGDAFEMPACLIVTLKDRKIFRLDEYLDPAPCLALLA